MNTICTSITTRCVFSFDASCIHLLCLKFFRVIINSIRTAGGMRIEWLLRMCNIILNISNIYLALRQCIGISCIGVETCPAEKGTRKIGSVWF